MTEPVPETAAAKKPQLAVQRLYAKDVSFEAPGAPAVFTQQWEPETSVQFANGATRLSENQYEAVLQVTVTTTVKGKTIYIAEVRFAGVFHIEGIDGAALEQVLNVHCPNILYPYVRELVSDLITRGSFPQFILQPMNFEAIYLDAKRRQQAGAAEQTPAH